MGLYQKWGGFSRTPLQYPKHKNRILHFSHMDTSSKQHIYVPLLFWSTTVTFPHCLYDLSTFLCCICSNVREAVYVQYLMGVNGVIVDMVEEISKAVADFSRQPLSRSSLGSDISSLDESKHHAFSQQQLGFLLRLIPELIEQPHWILHKWHLFIDLQAYVRLSSSEFFRRMNWFWAPFGQIRWYTV